MSIEPLTAERFSSFYGFMPESLVRGVAMEVDGRIEGVAGILFCGNFWYGFADLLEGCRARKRHVVKAIREMRRIMGSRRLPVIVSRDDSEDTSEGFLSHIGFEEEGEVWRFDNERF